MKVESAPTLFLIAVVALVMLVQGLGSGDDDVASSPPASQPAIQLAGISLPESLAKKAAGTQVALLRTPIGLARRDPPQR